MRIIGRNRPPVKDLHERAKRPPAFFDRSTASHSRISDVRRLSPDDVLVAEKNRSQGRVLARVHPHAIAGNRPDGRMHRDGAITAGRAARAAKIAVPAEPGGQRAPNYQMDKVHT
jgi:hypothetical protein